VQTMRAVPLRTLALLLPALALSGGPARGAAVHEVPAEVAVQIYVRPEGDTLTVLVRVPLAALRDMEWPLEGPGYLVLEGLELRLRDAVGLWITDELRVYQDGRLLPEETVAAVRVSSPGDRRFRSYREATAHLAGAPLPEGTLLPAGQALVDARLTVPITDDRARFAVEPELAHLGVRTLSVIHFLPPEGPERVFQYRGNPGRVELDPRWMHAALTFVRGGFRHILAGVDHLLFLLCLVIPFRRIAPLVPVVTAFTVAHSITLGAAALGLTPTALWFPALVETLIALSIVWMALENLLGTGLARRWQLAFGFGLVHGFGFSFVLQDTLQFAGRHLVTSLLAFNVGVEVGQLLVLAAVVPALNLLFRRVPARAGAVVLSALVAHTAWHWMTARGGELLAHDFAWPAAGPLLLATVLRWLALGAVAAAAGWALAEAFRRWAPAPSPAPGEG
ncbi:MAG: HupE/UreJ family protein, partial [Longimicrobiales bacterium]|nr:HupE/UreJ family protein [Longimicrobiales bacterium]